MCEVFLQEEQKLNAVKLLFNLLALYISDKDFKPESFKRLSNQPYEAFKKQFSTIRSSTEPDDVSKMLNSEHLIISVVFEIINFGLTTISPQSHDKPEAAENRQQLLASMIKTHEIICKVTRRCDSLQTPTDASNAAVYTSNLGSLGQQQKMLLMVADLSIAAIEEYTAKVVPQVSTSRRLPPAAMRVVVKITIPRLVQFLYTHEFEKDTGERSRPTKRPRGDQESSPLAESASAKKPKGQSQKKEPILLDGRASIENRNHMLRSYSSLYIPRFYIKSQLQPNPLNLRVNELEVKRFNMDSDSVSLYSEEKKQNAAIILLKKLFHSFSSQEHGCFVIAQVARNRKTSVLKQLSSSLEEYNTPFPKFVQFLKPGEEKNFYGINLNKLLEILTPMTESQKQACFSMDDGLVAC